QTRVQPFRRSPARCLTSTPAAQGFPRGVSLDGEHRPHEGGVYSLSNASRKRSTSPLHQRTHPGLSRNGRGNRPRDAQRHTVRGVMDSRAATSFTDNNSRRSAFRIITYLPILDELVLSFLTFLPTLMYKRTQTEEKNQVVRSSCTGSHALTSDATQRRV